MTGGLKSRRDAAMASATPMSGSHIVIAWGGDPARACSKNQSVLASVSYVGRAQQHYVSFLSLSSLY